jgi:cell shape-determining protein MreC
MSGVTGKVQYVSDDKSVLVLVLVVGHAYNVQVVSGGGGGTEGEKKRTTQKKMEQGQTSEKVGLRDEVSFGNT